jgi:NitT/TauT family transport system substrate-binding protein
MKRSVIFLLMAGILGIVLIGTGCARKKPEPQTVKTIDKIRLGVMTDNFNDYAGTVGNAEGIFEKYGLEVEITSFARGINTIDAVTIGQIDIGGGADFAVLNRLGGSQTTPLRIFSGMGDTLNASRLYTKDPSINSPVDLAGKSIVVQLGTVDEYYIAKTLSSVGVPQPQVKFLPIDGAMEGVVLIQNGTASAMWAGGRAAEALNGVEGVRVVARLADYVASTVNVAIATDQYLMENQRAVQKYLQATEEIFQFFKSNPERTAEIIHKANAVPTEQVLTNLKTWNNYVEFDQRFYDTLQSMYDWAAGREIIKYPYDLHIYVNVDALKAAFPGRGEFK